MADHWRAPRELPEYMRPGYIRFVPTDEQPPISRDIMFAIIFGCVGILIGFGMGMVVS